MHILTSNRTTKTSMEPPFGMSSLAKQAQIYFPDTSQSVSEPYETDTDGQFGVPPPSYVDSLNTDLILAQNYMPASLIHIIGESRSPDLHVSVPNGTKLFSFETDSTLVYHETAIRDLSLGSTLFRIRRRPIEAQPDGFWRYTAHSHVPGQVGSDGLKVLEIDTDPGMLNLREPWSTRLIFRHARTGELDGLTLTIVSGDKTSLNGEVQYRGRRVADILSKQKSIAGKHRPEYDGRIYHRGLDPLLISLCAYVLDDRTMVRKRRNRESAFAGLAGIGKGPGAGLAGAYALGGAI